MDLRVEPRLLSHRRDRLGYRTIVRGIPLSGNEPDFLTVVAGLREECSGLVQILGNRRGIRVVQCVRRRQQLI